MFEVITKDEFDRSGTVTLEPERGGLEDSVSGAVSVEGVGNAAAGTYPLVYCDFCKGYYYEDLHYGREEE